MFKKHPVLTAITIILALLLLAMFVTGVMILNFGSTQEAILPQYLLVLGTTVNGAEPSAMLLDRINAAYDYLTAHPEVTCIVSGYRNNADISEAECMYNELTKMGISPDRIWTEDQASSTVENFNFSLALIEEKTGARPDWITVLSSEFHLFRSSIFARECGVNAVYVGAETTDLPTFVYYFLREIFLVWYYSIF